MSMSWSRIIPISSYNRRWDTTFPIEVDLENIDDVKKQKRAEYSKLLMPFFDPKAHELNEEDVALDQHRLLEWQLRKYADMAMAIR